MKEVIKCGERSQTDSISLTGLSLGRQELYREIVQKLREMPESLQQAFVLRHYQGASLHDIAAQLHVNEIDAGLMLKRAEKRMSRSLHDFTAPTAR